jgi:ABC-type iron transport system FetAB permease component
MLLGNAISAIGVAWNTVQKEFADNRDKVETYLAMGASRFEACKPIACEALKLALLPTVNQMSIIGLISIPGGWKQSGEHNTDVRHDDWCYCRRQERRAGRQAAE